MVGWTELILFSCGLGVVIGAFTHIGQRKNKQSVTAQVPIMGTFLAYEYWWPRDNTQKNILVDKLIIMVYMLMGAFISPIFFAFTSIPLLFSHDWFATDKD